MVKMTDVGMEVFPGITIKWQWVDGILCGIIEKIDAGVGTDLAVGKFDDALQKFVDNTKLVFDNVAKEKLEKAFTLSMVKKFMPELLPPNP